MYNSEARVYNWFFVTQDPFYMIPQKIAPYIMPFLNLTLFFAAEIIVYVVFLKVKLLFNRKGNNF